MKSESGRSRNPLRMLAEIPPPLLVVVALAIGIAISVFWVPLRIFSSGWIAHAVGWPLFALGALILGWAFRAMSRADENPDPGKPTKSIVDAGPFGLSRNPIYLAFMLAYSGLSLVANTYWPLIFLPALAAVLHFKVVRGEESYLGELLGDEYRSYKAAVRRWI